MGPWLFFLLCLEAFCFKQTAATPALARYRVDLNTISVSGLSSGGYFAVQFHVAFSEMIIGAGIVAGGPFYCARGDIQTALSACMASPDLINVTDLVESTRSFASAGVIDDTKNLADDRVYLFSGTLDTVVAPGVVKKLQEYYNAFISDADQEEVYTVPAEHSMVSDDYGNTCNTLASPYINNCSYPTAYYILNHIYGGIAPANSSGGVPQNLIEYDQAPFFSGDPAAVSMDTIGYIYVPTACQDSSNVCRLHIAFHGCLQGREFVSSQYVLNAGYIQVAELNNIIVLFPQVTNSMPGGTNPQGCWDWWGYTAKDYAYNTGPQMFGVKQMVNAISGIQQTALREEATDDNGTCMDACKGDSALSKHL